MILRHFNLLTVVDVENLVRDHFKVAIFIAHMPHNNGTSCSVITTLISRFGQPDASAMNLLNELEDAVKKELLRDTPTREERRQSRQEDKEGNKWIRFHDTDIRPQFFV